MSTNADDQLGSITDAPPPFNKSTADVILRSSDLVDFRVKKAILAEASPFFDTMFTLPQCSCPPNSRQGRKGGHDPDYRDNLPVIPMTEDSHTLGLLLRICYPIALPAMTAENMLLLGHAALKYSVDGALSTIQQFLSVAAGQMPLQVYLIAITFKCEKEARKAARAFLHATVPDEYVPELEGFDAGAYHRLLAYRKECGKRAKQLTSADRMRWLKDETWPWLICSDTIKTSRCDFKRDSMSICGRYTSPSLWWWNYVLRMGDVLEVMPSGNALYAAGLMDQTLKEASKCPKCWEVAHAKLRRFTDLLAAEVERVVEEVNLEIK